MTEQSYAAWTTKLSAIDNLKSAVYSFMEFARIYSVLIDLDEEFDEVIEDYDFEQWLFGSTDDNIRKTASHISGASLALNNIVRSSWQNVWLRTQELSEEDMNAEFGTVIHLSEDLFCIVYEDLMETSDYPKDIDDAFKVFKEAVMHASADAEKRSE